MKKFKRSVTVLLILSLLCLNLTACGKQAENDIGTLAPEFNFIDKSSDGSTVVYIADTDVTSLTLMSESVTLPTGYTMDGGEDLLDLETSETEQVSESVLSNSTVSTQIQTTINNTGTTVPTKYTTKRETTTKNSIVELVSNPVKIKSLDSRISVNSIGKQFWYTQLTEKEQTNYNAIVNAVKKHDAVVNFSEKLTLAEYEKIFGIVYYQNPELFWLCDKFDLHEDGMAANLYYNYTVSQTETMQKFLDTKVEALMKTISETTTDLKKLQLCHDYVCTHTTFSMDYGTACTVIGCLVDGIGQCAGYAKTMLYLCNIIDVPCMFVVGENSEGASHAWNYVQLNGEWYLLDATWDDPIMKIADPLNVSYQYFCVRDVDTINKSHFNVNIAVSSSKCKYFEVPKCTSTAQNIDYVYGNFATTYEEGYELLRKDLQEAVNIGRTTAHVKFATEDVYKTARKRLYDDKELVNLKKELEDIYGSNLIKTFAVSKENSLNYLQVTIVYN